MTDAPVPADGGRVSWFKRVPPGLVDTYKATGWIVEDVAPSHHDAHCVMMKYAGEGDPDGAPPMPTRQRKIIRTSYQQPMRQRWR